MAIVIARQILIGVYLTLWGKATCEVSFVICTGFKLSLNWRIVLEGRSSHGVLSSAPLQPN